MTQAPFKKRKVRFLKTIVNDERRTKEEHAQLRNKLTLDAI